MFHNSNRNGLARCEFGHIFLMTFYFLQLFFNLKDIVTRQLWKEEREPCRKGHVGIDGSNIIISALWRRLSAAASKLSHEKKKFSHL